MAVGLLGVTTSCLLTRTRNALLGMADTPDARTRATAFSSPPPGDASKPFPPPCLPTLPAPSPVPQADQLRKEVGAKRAFLGFTEGPIAFEPSFKVRGLGGGPQGLWGGCGAADA